MSRKRFILRTVVYLVYLALTVAGLRGAAVLGQWIGGWIGLVVACVVGLTVFFLFSIVCGVAMAVVTAMERAEDDE